MITPEKLIGNLSEDLRPVRRLSPPYIRLLQWYGFGFFSVLFAMLLIQSFRANFWTQFSSLSFLFETLFSFVSGLTLGWLALVSAIPRERVRSKIFILMTLPLVIFSGFLLWGYFVEPSLPPSMIGKRPYCFYEVLFLSWIPISFLVLFVRKGYGSGDRKQVFAIGLAGASMPAAFMQVACMYDPYHLISHHLYPVLLVALVMFGLGAGILRKP